MDFYTNFQLIKGKVFVKGYRNGNRFVERIPYAPSLFVKSQTNKPTKYKTIFGEYLEKVPFGSIADAREFVNTYKEVSNFDIYGQTKYEYACMSDMYPQETVEWDMKQLRVLFLDIEVASEYGFPEPDEAKEEVLLITVQDLATKTLTTFGCGEYDDTVSKTTYIKCRDEKDLLTRFLNFWSANYPDIVTGWNIQLFDIAYLVNRYKKLFDDGVATKLSVWGLKPREFEKFGRIQKMYDLVGIAVIDYLDLYRKFTYSDQESWKLDHIAYIELNERKKDHSKYENFTAFYKNNWKEFVEYNVHDVEIVFRFEQKLRMIELCCTMAYDAKINFEDIFSQIRFWDTVIFNFLKRKDIVIPSLQHCNKREAFAGAYVAEPKMGLYKWVISFDATSLYPSFILQYNISPETMMSMETDRRVEIPELLSNSIDLSDLKQKNVGMAANGVLFNNETIGIFPELVRKFFDSRQEFKKKMFEADQKYKETKDEYWLSEKAKFDVYQMARKISINSLYGVLGSPYFRYFSIRSAEAITLSGQTVVQLASHAIDNYLNDVFKNKVRKTYAFYGDTDSVYITLDDLVQRVLPNETNPRAIVKFLDEVCKTKLQKLLKDTCDEFATRTNAFQSSIEFKREKIADAGIWTGKKKRYAVRVYNSEGKDYDPPELKITGIEVVRSSTPEIVRERLRESIAMVLGGKEEEMWKFIADFREQFKTYSADKIAFPRSVSELAAYTSSNTIYKKATPIAVRGALMYNHLLKKLHLEKKYALINEGEKVKFIYLKTPNVIGENVIAFQSVLPLEFKVDIDYDLMFQKTFLDPLGSILDCVGWKSEYAHSIDSLFG